MKKLNIHWQDIRSLLHKYRHGLLFLYAFIYLPWFRYLEQTVTSRFHIVHMVLDDYIPFIEFFIVPYLFWFIYVSVPLVYFFINEPDNFKKMCCFLFSGMTIFLIISTVYPNGAYLRPIVFPRDNIFTEAVKMLYATDTATNLFPSIHVYNSIATHWAISKSKYLKSHKKLLLASQVSMVLIILSTMFLKQHSVFDVLTGIALALFIGILVYTPDWLRQRRTGKVRLEKNREI